jgi:hypothetical protein
MVEEGTFEISMTAEPPYDSLEGVTLARASFAKRFAGPLAGESTVHMLAARTPVAESAGYVALERIAGSLAGRRGSFVVVHLGLMDRGRRSLTISIVPDSGTGELSGIAGTMDIDIRDGQHHYRIDYSLPAA